MRFFEQRDSRKVVGGNRSNERCWPRERMEWQAEPMTALSADRSQDKTSTVCAGVTLLPFLLQLHSTPVNTLYKYH